MHYSGLSKSSNPRIGLRALVTLILMATSLAAHADARTQAKRIHDRLTGVPPSMATLDTMETMVKNGNASGAAYEAMKNRSFYTTTLKNWVTPWTSEDATPYAELNDFSATVIGMIRDDVPFNTVLSDDIVYTGSATALPNTPYSQVNNNHYAALEMNRANLSDPLVLVRTTQSSLPGTQLAPENTAGIMTTRAFSTAFIREGTNRRAIRFVFKNFLCRDIEDVSDVTRTPDRVRQDVTRSPGGDSIIYLNQCVGCHAGMDPLAQAFAYYDYQEITKDAGRQLVMTPGKVQLKNHINAGNFPLGYFVSDDKWDNYWREGKNANLGWAPKSSEFPGSGRGIKSLGKELAASRAFAACQVQKAFKLTCLKDPANQADIDKVNAITDTFMTSNYSMKSVFAETAAYCKGE